MKRKDVSRSMAPVPRAVRRSVILHLLRKVLNLLSANDLFPLCPARAL